MSKYVENVNAYLSQMKIKQTFVSLRSGIETSKLSRILKGTQEINASDMERIACALGRKAEYFMSENFHVPSPEDASSARVAFYAGEPSKKQEEFAMQLIELIENADEVLSARGRYMMVNGE